jgi:hypothetical protein
VKRLGPGFGTECPSPEPETLRGFQLQWKGIMRPASSVPMSLGHGEPLRSARRYPSRLHG